MITGARYASRIPDPHYRLPKGVEDQFLVVQVVIKTNSAQVLTSTLSISVGGNIGVWGAIEGFEVIK